MNFIIQRNVLFRFQTNKQKMNKITLHFYVRRYEFESSSCRIYLDQNPITRILISLHVKCTYSFANQLSLFMIYATNTQYCMNI